MLRRLYQRVARWKRTHPPFPRQAGSEYDDRMERARPYGGERVAPAPFRRNYPGGMAPEGGQSIRLAPYNFPPRGALAIDDFVSFDFNAAAPSAFALNVVNVPVGMQARIDAVGFGGPDESLLQVASWSLGITQFPVQTGLPQPSEPSRYTNLPMGVSSLDQPRPIRWTVSGEVFIVVTATFPASTITETITIWANLVGWLFVESPLHLEGVDL
jgi:hypothetical protein